MKFSHRAAAFASATSTLVIWLIVLVVSSRSCLAQVTGFRDGATDEDILEEEVTDPLAHLSQVQVKDIYTPAAYGTNAQPNTVQFRSIAWVRPFWLMPFQQLIRPTLKVVTAPDGKGSSTTTGYDDTQLLDLIEIPWPNSEATHFRWGLGSYNVFPTATSNRMGQGAWQMGPAMGFSYLGIPGLNLSGLMQQATSFAYTSSHSTPITSISFQPIISYQLGHGWSLKSSDATWSFNLRHNTATTIPLSAGIGKVWKFSDDYAVDTAVSGQWMVYRQFANRADQFTLTYTVTLLLPKLGL